jgi:NADH-quinone oxidoreductase subunit C
MTSTGPATDAPASAGAATPAVPAALAAVMPEVPRTAGSHVDVVAFPPRARYAEMVAAFRAAGFELLTDLCAVDYLVHPGRTLPDGVAPERFEVVVNLLSLSAKLRVRIRVQVSEGDPEVPSLIDLYPGVDAMEREAFDLVGVRFTGHPDLTRILMPEDWEGHPLRKDYGVGRVPIQFKEAPGPR